jgi:ABC-2 type transport system permease protein
VIDLVAAEWLKLRTTRLLHGLIPAAIAISLAAVAGAVLSANGAETLESGDGIRRVFSVTGAGAILVLVAGVIMSAGEHRHGTAPDTFLTTPRRRQVVAAKLATGAVLGVATGAITSLGCVGMASLLYSLEGAAFPLDDVEMWLTLAGAVAYTALFAVLGVGLGSVVRNQVLAVAGALAWLAVVEHTLVNLAPDIGRWLPAAAGQAIVRTPLDGLLSPLTGGAVLALYAGAVALAGVQVAATRDV